VGLNDQQGAREEPLYAQKLRLGGCVSADLTVRRHGFEVEIELRII
jgi:hypothetical protein